MCRFIAFIICIAFLFVQPFSAVTELQAEFRKGKTYITFQEEGGAGKRYNIYRATGPIASISGLTPLVTLHDSTNRGFVKTAANEYTTFPLIITELGSPLSDNTGLFVYTPKENRQAYYAVTPVDPSNGENATITPGANALVSPVAEEYWPWPQGVLRAEEDVWGNKAYRYYYWMDYFDWPNDLEYYGNFFVIGVHQSVLSATDIPVRVELRAYGTNNYGEPGANFFQDMIRLNVKDPEQTWWYGKYNDNYTERRIVSYLHAMIENPLFAIDTNRIYVSGNSMGGGGGLLMALRHPELFAAAQFSNAGPVYHDTSDHSYLNLSNLKYPGTSRQALESYVVNNQLPLTPILDFWGSQDGADYGQTGHAALYSVLCRAGQFFTGRWFDQAHRAPPPGALDNMVPGEWFRFVKNELIPAFAYSTADDNYGTFEGGPFDAAGEANTYIDWTSSRHDMGLPNDDLIDKPDTIAITMKSSRSGTRADVCPRRIQNFLLNPGDTVAWKNINVTSGTVVNSGMCVADANGIVVVKQFSISTSGNKLVMTTTRDFGFLSVHVKDGATQTPLPGATATLNSNEKSTSDNNGAATFLTDAGSGNLSVSMPTYGPSASQPVQIVQGETTFVTVALSRLNVTGLFFNPGSLSYRVGDTFRPSVHGLYSDGASAVINTGLTLTALEPQLLAVNASNAVTANAPGEGHLVASYTSFADTGYVSIVDTQLVLQSIVLSEHSITVEAGMSHPLNVNGEYAQYGDMVTFSVDSVANWFSLDTAFAAVEGGVVIGKSVVASIAVVAELNGFTDTCFVKVRAPLAYQKRINFTLDTIPHKEGWEADNGIPYTAARGHGWTNLPGRILSNNRATNNPLLKSFVTPTESDNSTNTTGHYKMDMPDGQYIIRAGVGDNIYGGSGSVVFANDTIVQVNMSNYEASKNNFVKTYTVTVSGGAGLTLSMFGPINYLVVISSEGVGMDEVADDGGLPLYVTLIAYYGAVDDTPSIVVGGFVEGAVEASDRPNAFWTNVPSELSGNTYLLTARDDKNHSLAENAVFYTVYVSRACDILALVDMNTTIPSWISADGWEDTGLTLTGSGDAYGIFRKTVDAAGNVDLKRQKRAASQGTGFVFMLPGSFSYLAQKQDVQAVYGSSLSAYPNPFNPSTSIHYRLLPNAKALYGIYNSRGQRVFSVSIVSGPTGKRGTIYWNGVNENGRAAGSGWYIGRLVTREGKIYSHRMLLIK
jgi:pimeloyl-ACP methyl ester carboxylesterase